MSQSNHRIDFPGGSGASAAIADDIQLNDNGAWSWFMDERCVVNKGWLLVGSVRSTHLGMVEGRALPGWGNIELSALHLESGKTHRILLHEGLEQDDHNGPSLLVLPDGRFLAVYTRHSWERRAYVRISEVDNPLAWGPVKVVETPGVDHPPYGGDNVTYSNLFQFGEGRIYCFFRSLGHQQNWMFSDDQGQTWTHGGMFLRGLDGYAPYFKYAASHNAIHFVGTEDHPRKFDNSVYHGFVCDGHIFQSDGKLRGPLSTTPDPSGDIREMTCVFRGDADHVAWVTDLHINAEGHPVCLFTVQKDGRGLSPGQGGMDHRFYYAVWDGSSWSAGEIAHAGSRLYSWEDDYTGLGAIDPQDTASVYISTNADPVSGAPPTSQRDGARHHELYHGCSHDGGKSWHWTPLTSDSEADNLRPIVPIWRDPRVALVWMRGTYSHNTGPWSTSVMARIFARPSQAIPLSKKP